MSTSATPVAIIYCIHPGGHHHGSNLINDQLVKFI